MTYLEIVEDFFELCDELEEVNLDFSQKRKEIKKLANKCRDMDFFKKHISEYNAYYEACVQLGNTSKDEFYALCTHRSKKSVLFVFALVLKMPVIDTLLAKETINEWRKVIMKKSYEQQFKDLVRVILGDLGHLRSCIKRGSYKDIEEFKKIQGAINELESLVWYTENNKED